MGPPQLLKMMTMKNRRDFLRNTLGLSASFAAASRLFAAPHESGTGTDRKHMSHATQRSSGLIVSVETPDIPLEFGRFLCKLPHLGCIRMEWLSAFGSVNPSACSSL